MQETWAGRPGATGLSSTAAQIRAWLRHATDAVGAPPYLTYWADNAEAAGENNGTLICVRPRAALTTSAHVAFASGRLQTLTLSWAGHALALVNTYWPCTGHAARAAFLAGALSQVLDAQPSACVVGDFNFTPQPALDRLHCASSTANSDLATSTLLATVLPAHCDAFRHLHPAAPSFTFHRGAQRARLDRVLLPPALLAFVASARVVHCGQGDHHAVQVDLMPAAPVRSPGPGRRAVPSTLPRAPAAAAGLVAFAQRAINYSQALSDAELLAWWPHLERAYTAHARAVLACTRWARSEARSEVEAAEAALAAAELAVAAAPSAAAVAAAMPASLAARERLHRSAANNTCSARAAFAAAWLQHAERPTPTVTSLLTTPCPPPGVAALCAPDGTLLTANRAIAARFAQHYAAISCAPVTTTAAQDEVLAAVEADLAAGFAQPLPPALAAAAGSAAVRESEVRAAMASCPAASSPGPDGLPYAMWRVGGGCWAPLLARLFSAMGALQQAPPGFNAGTITPILKPGADDTTAPPSYRPITLLSSLYRLLSKVLAARFGAAMAHSIGPEQAAYLPGRRIEDNINFASLLPDVLAASGESAAIVYLDVAKAFDSVDRGFLYRTMGVMGATDGMVAWARLLLSDTCASVHVNGVESAPLLWHAGVRQGCPLSPLLYLFVGQALASWLRAQPELGIHVAGQRYVSSMYADDTYALMRLAAAAATALRTALTTFRNASGQGVNFSKSVAVAVGRPLPRPLPPDFGGIPIQATRLHLGIVCSNPPPPPPSPPPRLHLSTRSADRPFHPPPHPPPRRSPQPHGPPAAALLAPPSVVSATCPCLP